MQGGKGLSTCSKCVYYSQTKVYCSEWEATAEPDHSCSRFVAEEGHLTTDFKPMMTVQITDDPPALPVEEKPDRYTLLKHVAEMYRRGDKLKHIAQAIGYSIGGVSGLVDEAYGLRMIDSYRRPKQIRPSRRRQEVVSMSKSDDPKMTNQDGVGAVNPDDTKLLMSYLPTWTEEDLRTMYAAIEREMGRRVLRGA